MQGARSLASIWLMLFCFSYDVFPIQRPVQHGQEHGEVEGGLRKTYAESQSRGAVSLGLTDQVGAVGAPGLPRILSASFSPPHGALPLPPRSCA